MSEASRVGNRAMQQRTITILFGVREFSRSVEFERGKRKTNTTRENTTARSFECVIYLEKQRADFLAKRVELVARHDRPVHDGRMAAEANSALAAAVLNQIDSGPDWLQY